MVEGWVNGERRQARRHAELIFPIEHLVEYITFVMTLEPGDVISTGTPSGVGSLKAGDVVTVKVEGVGELRIRWRLRLNGCKFKIGDDDRNRPRNLKSEI